MCPVYLQGYMKRLQAHITKTNPDRLPAFKASAQAAVKKVQHLYIHKATLPKIRAFPVQCMCCFVSVVCTCTCHTDSWHFQRLAVLLWWKGCGWRWYADFHELQGWWDYSIHAILQGWFSWRESGKWQTLRYVMYIQCTIQKDIWKVGMKINAGLASKAQWSQQILYLVVCHCQKPFGRIGDLEKDCHD